MSTLASVIQRGTRAAQPSAASVPVGTLYYVTDETILERSTGAAWQSYSIAVASAGALTRIQQIVTASSQSTVDFTSIPATYSSLLVEWISRDTQAGTSVVGLNLKINNDGTSGNYTSVFRSGSQNASAVVSNIAASAAGVQIGAHPQDGNTAGIVGTGTIKIVGYASTTWHKRILAHFGQDDATNNGLTAFHNARWKSTAALNRLTFGTDGTAFKDGSIWTLYGLT